MKYQKTDNPNILSDEPTHLWNGVKVKVYIPWGGFYASGFCMHTGLKVSGAEIKEGPDKGKQTSVYHDERLQAL